MSGYLLDTHVLLWWLSEPERLSEEVRDAIRDVRNPVFLSAAAAWEMAIKASIGRLDMPSNLPEVLRAENIGVLEVGLAHALAVADLPPIHRDPFDRIQIVQARVENLTLVSRDRDFARYDVRLLKA